MTKPSPSCPSGQVSETALGNFELAIEHRIAVSPATRLGLLAGALVPTASHGPESSLLDNRALAIANALNTGKDAALSTPGVTGVRLGVSLEHSVHSLELRVSVGVPLLVAVSDASLPEDTETRPFGILPTFDVRAAAWITSWFAASLGSGLIAEPLRVHEPARERDRDRRLQAVIEPGLHTRFGQHVALGLDATVPVGGNLGGRAWSVSLLSRVGF